jgi:hypothetical protein
MDSPKQHRKHGEQRQQRKNDCNRRVMDSKGNRGKMDTEMDGTKHHRKHGQQRQQRKDGHCNRGVMDRGKAKGETSKEGVCCEQEMKKYGRVAHNTVQAHETHQLLCPFCTQAAFAGCPPYFADISAGPKLDTPKNSAYLCPWTDKLKKCKTGTLVPGMGCSRMERGGGGGERRTRKEVETDNTFYKKYRQTDKRTDTHTHTHTTERETDRDRQTDRQTDSRQKDRQTDRENKERVTFHNSKS